MTQFTGPQVVQTYYRDGGLVDLSVSVPTHWQDSDILGYARDEERKVKDWTIRGERRPETWRDGYVRVTLEGKL